jgi:hypothetical protein
MSRIHKKDWGPGYRFFKCDECGHEWTSKSRDWTSPSLELCPISEQDYDKCSHGIGCYEGGEPHYEWPTDQSGNLINE